MRIVIDLQGAQTESRFRGIGRYAMGFSQAVARNHGEHEVFLALNGLFPETIEPIRLAFEGFLPQENIRVWHAPGPVQEENPDNEARRNIAELVREAFLASLKPDVIHVISLFEGYVDDAVTSIGRFDETTPVTVTLFDLIPLLNPDHYLMPNPQFAAYYEGKVGSLRQAASFFAISEFTRQEGLANLGVLDHQVVNASTAIESRFQPFDINEDAVKCFLKRIGVTRPFILYTGGADECKNLPRLIQAYAELSSALRAGHQLLFAGKISKSDVLRLRNQAKTAGLKADELVLTGYISDEELIQLYNLCELFVFPSWHEGFGLSALEAISCGAPTIAANTTSLPEVIGMDEAMFDPFDVSAITAKVEQALVDQDFRKLLRTNSLQRAKLFSWDETARRAIRAWEALLEKAITTPIDRLIGCKPKLAFVSPLPPERTGIADYSVELLPALTEYYEINIVVLQYHVDSPWVNHHCKVRDVAWLREHAGEIDRVLYHIGNSPFHGHMWPLINEIHGTVVLHDFFISGLLAWLESQTGAGKTWTKALYDSHGYAAVQDRYRDTAAAQRDYPANFAVIQNALGVIVHSHYSKQLGQEWYGDELPLDWRVIPHLRKPAPAFDQKETKRQLGFDANDFLICSFGFLGPTKLNNRLLECWLESSLFKDTHCHLVFVGENHDGRYGADLHEKIKQSGAKNRLHIIGFAAPDLYELYLNAADTAVQLRALSRGETSGTALDCMNHAVPLVVNANGSMGELDPSAVWMLPEEFGNENLIEALETLRIDSDKRRILGQYACTIIKKRHSPEACARKYVEAIEHFERRNETSTSRLIDSIAANFKTALNESALLNLSTSIAANMPLAQPAKRLFLDVTATCRNDLKTGIERVARALMIAMIGAAPSGFRVEPVYLDNVSGAWHHRYARDFTLEKLGCPADGFDNDLIEPASGDILLGLDLSGDSLIQAQKNMLFENYRNNGVSVYCIVFDLLPVNMPDVFPPGADTVHEEWLCSITSFDGVVGISKTTADDFYNWQKKHGRNLSRRRDFKINWFHLGADVANSSPSKGLTANAPKIIEELQTRTTFLMVGTIEPRKGHWQTIEGFTKLWKNHADINLVIVGKEGWRGLPDDMRRNIPQTVQCLRNHPERNKRLFWLDGISDEYLEKVYAASTCLIAASYGEGFGLPLIEAAQHKLPIIARDIPVFREVAGDHAYYFNSEDPAKLAGAIEDWLNLYEKNKHPRSDNMPWLTWEESAAQLMHILINDPDQADTRTDETPLEKSFS